jgi:uncharacterized protein YbaA (DUF1428 family)
MDACPMLARCLRSEHGLPKHVEEQDVSYIEGFVAAVPAANKDLYLKHASTALPLVKEFGVSRMVENWGDDVPDGKLTDFRRSVKAEADEVIVFSWFAYPDRETRVQANEKMIADPRMEAFGDMPFDGKRMIYGGFAPISEAGPGGSFGYVDGSLIPVPNARRDEYRAFAELCAGVFLEHGATKLMDAWGDDVPDGKITDFRRAVQAESDETVVFSWIEWPSKEVRDAAWPKVMADPRMQGVDVPFDGKRMIFGGFRPILDG